MSVERSKALADLRVIDLSHGPAVGLATMVLADFGAEIIRIDAGPHPLDEMPSARMWLRGKDRRRLDLASASAELVPLLEGADVFVSNYAEPYLDQHGLGPEQLRQQYPHLIVAHLSGFGHVGPMKDVPGYEHVVAAYCGRMLTFQGLADREGPVFSALQVGIHAASQSLLQGILAGVFRQSVDGTGSLVRTSLLQGMLPYEQGAMIGRQFTDQLGDWVALPIPPEPPLPTLFYHPAQAGDGRWMQFGNLLPHLFDNFLLVTDLADVLADPEFDPKQLRLPEEKHEAFRMRMLRRLQERRAQEWMTDCIENGGVVATTYQTTREALDDPDIVANGHALALPNGERQLGPLARLARTPAHPLATVPAPTPWDARTRPAAGAAQRPLEGVRVVEIATIIAAPLGASYLADLGAHVTKIEQVGGDPYRGFNAGVGSARVNAGKESISLNLKSKEGVEIALRLIEQADIVIHNYRPGVPERLGLSYEDVLKRNPNIVYLQSNGYGPDGPGALRPSTHPIPGGAMGGVLYQLGDRLPTSLQDAEGLRLWTSRLMRANEVNPDPNTALVVASSALLGLTTRARTGEGQQIFVDMFGANAYANHDDFLDYPGKPDRTLPDESLLGLSPTYRLYRCANEQWIFLALVSESEKQRFQEAVTAHLSAPLDWEDAALEEALSEIFAMHDAEIWERELVEHRVGCVRADRYNPAAFWLENEQAAALGLTMPARHPQWGDYRRHGVQVRVGDAPPPFAPPPLAGQHSRQILEALGYEDATIAELYDRGVVWSEAPKSRA